MEVASSSTERCPSGRRSTPGKCVYGNVPRVRIPPSPPELKKGAVCPFFNSDCEGGVDGPSRVRLERVARSMLRATRERTSARSGGGPAGVRASAWADGRIIPPSPPDSRRLNRSVAGLGWEAVVEVYRADSRCRPQPDTEYLQIQDLRICWLVTCCFSKSDSNTCVCYEPF